MEEARPVPLALLAQVVPAMIYVQDRPGLRRAKTAVRVEWRARGVRPLVAGVRMRDLEAPPSMYLARGHSGRAHGCFGWASKSSTMTGFVATRVH